MDETNSKEILEQMLLPIWSKKQRQIEEYIETVEVNIYSDLAISFFQYIYFIHKDGI